MLQLEGLYWITNNLSNTLKQLGQLGFNITPNPRDPNIQSVYFGPDCLNIIGHDQKLQSVDPSGFKSKSGISAASFETNDIQSVHQRFEQTKIRILNPRKAAKENDGNAEWYGFDVESSQCPHLNSWIVMNAPGIIEKQRQDNLPYTHSNTVFGIESVQLLCENPAKSAESWAQVLGQNFSGLNWNELGETQGKRFQTGDRFFDFLKLKKMNLAKGSGDQEGVAMVTFRVGNLEQAKEQMIKAGAKIKPCQNRDGFLVGCEFAGGPYLRFVRAYRKPYLPLTPQNYPQGRRQDSFRPLGGANSTTLVEGFRDNWKH